MNTTNNESLAELITELEESVKDLEAYQLKYTPRRPSLFERFTNWTNENFLRLLLVSGITGSLTAFLMTYLVFATVRALVTP